MQAMACYAVDKFDVLPDLPDSLVQTAEASTISNTGNSTDLVSHSVAHEPSIISVVLSLLFVIVLIYVTGILYAKLNKIGFKTLKKQQGELSKSQVAVVSTTQLGNNKTLHVVELDGKRMLIGASTSAIQLIKDLGVYNENGEEASEEYSHIEIPNIKIPKIEIPKIEIPTIGFSKIMTKAHKKIVEEFGSNAENVNEEENVATATPENPEEIIESLFEQATNDGMNIKAEPEPIQHKVDPDDYALYKKYINK